MANITLKLTNVSDRKSRSPVLLFYSQYDIFHWSTECYPNLTNHRVCKIPSSVVKQTFSSYIMEWRSRHFSDLRQYSMTITGIVGLQVPCLISRAPKRSSLAFFQTFGFPFNMTRRTLDDHFSFSPENLKAGRYYTVLTNLFHHAGNITFGYI